MAEHVVTLDSKKMRKEAKRREFKAKAQQTVVTGLRWIKDNWEIVSIAGTVLVGVTGKSIKMISKHRQNQFAKNLKDRYIYDRSNGHYWKLRKTPSNSDLLELERRRKDVGLGQALSDMRLI